MFSLKSGIYDLFSSKRISDRNALKIALFEVYRQLYHQNTLEEKSIFQLKATKTIWGIIWCFQVLSFLWTPSLSIKNWEENIIIWKIIGYFRIDNMCSEFGIINECLYLSVSFTFILGVCIICLAICVYFSLSISKFCKPFRWVFSFWLKIILMPSIAIYWIFLKYNIWPQERILEYKNNNHIKDFKISSALQFQIILALALCFFLFYFFTQFSAEIRHSESSRMIKAKAHSKVNTYLAIFTYFLPMFYVLLDENFMVYYQFLTMVISIIIMIESEILLPYFFLYCNLKQVLQIFTVVLTSFSFVLGCIMDNSLVIIFLVVIIWPISAIFVVQFTIKLQKNINENISKDINEVNSKYELEKKLRYWLCLNDTEHKNDIIYIFEKFFINNSSNRDKLQICWIANYCLFTLKDGPLATVKLNKTKTVSSWNLEDDFQEYLCRRNINESLSNESLKFISYYQQLNLIKKKDSKLCVYLLKFWEELISPKPDLKQLANKLKWIDKNILYLNDQYKELIANFSDSREGLTLYTSYSRDVIYDYEKSNLLQIKLRGLETLNSANTDLKIFSFLNGINGILIISGEPDTFGQILFANPRAAEMMKSSIGGLEESNLANFLHPYYCESVKKEIQWLICYGSSSEFDFSKGFFLNIPGKYLIEYTGKAAITSIGNNLVFILKFQEKQIKREIALLAETGEILCCSECFSEFAEKNNKNLIGYNAKDLFSESEIYESGLIFHSQNKQKVLFMSCTKVYNLKVFYALLINDIAEIQKWKNKNNHNENKESDIIANKQLLRPEEYNKKSYRSSQLSDEKYINSEAKLLKSGTYEEASELLENGSVSKSSDAKSQIPSQKRFFKMLAISSRSINILNFAFILSIIAVLSTNIVVLFYAFSYIDFIKNMEFPMAIAEAESRLQIAACTAQLLWVLSVDPDPGSKIDLLAVRTLLPGYIDDIRDIYMHIGSNLSKWNYCSSKTIVTHPRINVWDSDYIKRESLLDLLDQSAQNVIIMQGYDLMRKYNDSEDYTGEIRFLMMNGYGEGFQYMNNSLYEIIDCQKSLMLDFKVEVFVLLMLGIGVLALCFCVMIPFGYSVIKIENNFWNNLRKKAFQNYAEMKQVLLERLKSVHDQPEILSSNRNPSKKIFNFKNYWKYIWRICIYFAIVISFSLINIAYLYENCTNYLAYRPEIIRELVRTKIIINTLIIAASDSQYDVIEFPLNYLFYVHNYANSWEIFNKCISALRESRLKLRNPKYSPILSSNFKKMYYENDALPYTHYLDYGTYAAETELTHSGYLVSSVDVNDNPTYRWWVYNITLFRNNYDKYVDEIDNYSQSVIDDQVKTIVAAFSIFVMASIVIYFVLYFIFFKNEKKYLKKINSMMNVMPM